MALPPTIPSSFVPHSNQAPRRYGSDMTGAFGFFCYAVLAVVLILSIGVFSYGRILASTKAAKDKELVDAQNKIDLKVVDGFIRLRDRLATSQTLLDKHIALTGVFGVLEKIVPATVRLDSLHLSSDDTNHVKLEASGTAKTFNALAAASGAFAAPDSHVRDAIFSSLSLHKDNSVSFNLAATLDPTVVAFVLAPPAAGLPTGSSATSTP